MRLSEKVAVVGSREGADLDQVREFIHALHAKYPDTVIVSGGARGVDTTAEQEWLSLGGQVMSFRVRKLGLEEHGVERWDLGGQQPRLVFLANEPTWRTYESALIYRDVLIAEACDRLVLFHRRGWRGGGGITADIARAAEKPTYEYEKQEEPDGALQS